MLVLPGRVAGSGCLRGLDQPEEQEPWRGGEPSVRGGLAFLQSGQRRGFKQAVDDEAGSADGAGHDGERSAPERDLVRLLPAEVPGLGDLDRGELVPGIVRLPVSGRVVGGEHDRASWRQDAAELREWGVPVG